MKVYVVVADAMGGTSFVGAYRTRPNAQAGQRILEVSVLGVQPDPTYVYIAQTYDRTMDVFNFEGVYGNYEITLQRRGQDGSTLNVEI